MRASVGSVFENSLNSSNNSSNPSAFRGKISLENSGDSGFKPSDLRSSSSNNNIFEQTLQSKKSPPLPRAKTFNQEAGNVNEIAGKTPPRPPPFRKPTSDPFQETFEEAPPPLPGRPTQARGGVQVDSGPPLPSRPPMPARPAAKEDNNRPPQHSGETFLLIARNRREKEYIKRRKQKIYCVV
jgi:hypothetical protein